MRLSTSTNIYFNRPRGEKGSLDQCIRFCGQGGYKRMDLNLPDLITSLHYSANVLKTPWFYRYFSFCFIYCFRTFYRVML